MQWFDDLQRTTATPETAVRLRQARNHDDVTREAAGSRRARGAARRETTRSSRSPKAVCSPR